MKLMSCSTSIVCVTSGPSPRRSGTRVGCKTPCSRRSTRSPPAAAGAHPTLSGNWAERATTSPRASQRAADCNRSSVAAAFSSDVTRARAPRCCASRSGSAMVAAIACERWSRSLMNQRLEHDRSKACNGARRRRGSAPGLGTRLGARCTCRHRRTASDRTSNRVALPGRRMGKPSLHAGCSGESAHALSDDTYGVPATAVGHGERAPRRRFVPLRDNAHARPCRGSATSPRCPPLPPRT